ncbi:hypothetical protein QM646_51515, partial [Rhodococcus erythropolis]|nr:hypothetical protein [Rhodococcus erythropolis]
EWMDRHPRGTLSGSVCTAEWARRILRQHVVDEVGVPGRGHPSGAFAAQDGWVVVTRFSLPEDP